MTDVVGNSHQENGERGIPRILVLGLGNLLQRDDGVGIHTIRRFMRRTPRGVLTAEVGTDVFSACHMLERADKVIAFDALIAGGKPGSVYMLSANDVMDMGIRGSLHELGLVSMLRMVHRPALEVVVLAAEPEVIDWGMKLSRSLQTSVDRMVRTARALTAYWCSLPAGRSCSGTDFSDLGAVLSLRFMPAPELDGINAASRAGHSHTWPAGAPASADHEKCG